MIDQRLQRCSGRGLVVADLQGPCQSEVAPFSRRNLFCFLEGGGRSPVDWNISILLIGIAALVHWLLADPADAAPSMEPRLAWAVVLAPSYVALQLVPLPAFLLRILSPSRSGMVASLETVMQPPTFASLSINPTATVPYLLNIIAYALTFLLIREIACRCRQRAGRHPTG